jgi:hypothetical protein
MRLQLALIEQTLLGQHHLVNEAGNLFAHSPAQAPQNLAPRGFKALCPAQFDDPLELRQVLANQAAKDTQPLLLDWIVRGQLGKLPLNRLATLQGSAVWLEIALITCNDVAALGCLGIGNDGEQLVEPG